MDRRNFILKSAALAFSLTIPLKVLCKPLADNGLSGENFKRPSDSEFRKICYGHDKNNYFELRLPKAKNGNKSPLAIVIHGGYWRNKYSLDYTRYLCDWLSSNGIISVNMEYRRIGDVGGGYPGTFTDVAMCIDSLPEKLKSLDIYDVDLNNIVVIGHSAGGHLATWAFSRSNIHENSPLYKPNALKIKKAISLAGLLDLKYANDNHLSNDAVLELINGAPLDEISENISPIEMLPIRNGEVILFHGNQDNNVPIEISSEYSLKAKENCTYHIIDGAGHFDIVAPNSPYFNMIGDKILQSFS
ncbi:alpha/beta hydrolase [Providencia rettgeri]|uniref:alpha/beta hydrolase family protein n=1 Tax=Providencia rettgeri TaxID=587 RepID=UPI001CA786CA|nr:alpha/beta hydrolase [Providencia rettgeri]